MTDSAGPDDRGTEQAGSPGDSGWATSGSTAADPLDLERLAHDWITLWQSELSAMAADRELQETWQATLALWAGVASAAVTAFVRPPRRPGPPFGDGHDGGATRPEPPAWPTAAAAAPDARDAEVERLTRHVASLEARLEELERRRHPRRPAKRKR
jgi:hypothetical protein